MAGKFRAYSPRHVAIVGSRHLVDYRKLCTTIRPLLRPDDIIVSGGADGIDSLAERYARQNGHKFICFKPDQALIAAKIAEGMTREQAYGFAALARNTQIVDRSDVMFAIACDHSKGTLDSYRKMKVKLRDLGYDTAMVGGVIRLFLYLWPCGRLR